MIKYLDTRNTGDGWRRLPYSYMSGLNYKHFNNYHFEINGTIYTEWNERFTTAYDQFRLWKTLND